MIGCPTMKGPLYWNTLVFEVEDQGHTYKIDGFHCQVDDYVEVGVPRDVAEKAIRTLRDGYRDYLPVIQQFVEEHDYDGTPIDVPDEQICTEALSKVFDKVTLIENTYDPHIIVG